MRFIIPAVLIIVALIHALPIAGVIGAARLESLYGIAVQDPNLEILLRHRAVLFGLIAALLAWAAFRPQLHRIALIGGTISVVTFLALAASVGNYNSALSLVVKMDILALALLIIAIVMHFMRRDGSARGDKVGT